MTFSSYRFMLTAALLAVGSTIPVQERSAKSGFKVTSSQVRSPSLRCTQNMEELRDRTFLRLHYWHLDQSSLILIVRIKNIYAWSTDTLCYCISPMVACRDYVLSSPIWMMCV
jgi:hypothetical protein